METIEPVSAQTNGRPTVLPNSNILSSGDTTAADEPLPELPELPLSDEGVADAGVEGPVAPTRPATAQKVTTPRATRVRDRTLCMSFPGFMVSLFCLPKSCAGGDCIT